MGWKVSGHLRSTPIKNCLDISNFEYVPSNSNDVIGAEAFLKSHDLGHDL